MKKSFITTATLSLSLLVSHQLANATSLQLGADYSIRGVSIEERDSGIEDNQYYDQRLQAYLITDLSKDVEATIRIQSVGAWGMENSTTTLNTRYPDAKGDLWVQNAFLRLPRLWNNRIILTFGRQPIKWGDGAILDDDELGFNAIRAHIKSPYTWIPLELDVFTSKPKEQLRTSSNTFTSTGETDLHGAVFSFDRRNITWEIMGLLEQNDQTQMYQVGASSIPFQATEVKRQIIGVRARTNLQDAFLRGEIYFQDGDVTGDKTTSAPDIALGGMAYTIGLGGHANTEKFGRFGAIIELANGEGDDVGTPGEDEAFRPSFASRWSGLERHGYGRYFGATYSDAYNPSNPFGEVDSVNTGLPPGTSGIQTIRFGVESTPWAQWSFLFDYYQFKAQKSINPGKELGTEFDYAIEYRYSGLVTFRVTYNDFRPGNAYDSIDDTKQSATYATFETDIKF